MEYKTFVFCMLWSYLQICFSIDQASFYGNSYISVPFKEAKSSTDIYFKFRTRLSNALILLVAGLTDYCRVELENDRIKVNINLGAGESEIALPQNIKLNDFKWHEVNIQRREANFSLVIDKTLKVQKHLPGKFFELNIDYGLFVGDHRNKNDSDMFFGHLQKFRGCLSDLKYNDISVLQQARLRQSNTIVQGITWNCAGEFDVAIDKPISFVEDDAYMVILHKINNKELKLNFEIKTISENALLFYNPSNMMTDYFLIHIRNNTITATIKNGEKTIDLNNNIFVADGKWHKILFRMKTTILELIIDEKIKTRSNSHELNFKLGDSSYLGGLEISKRFRAMAKGCKSCDNGYKGCIRHLVVNEIKKGLPDTQVTEGLMPGCIWHYPCLQNPCNDNSICVQQGLNSFNCNCKEQYCLKSNYTEGYKIFSKNSLATDLEILSVEPLEVLEGQSQIITTKNLHMVLDYQKYGIKDSGIRFFIVENPEHGSITVDVWTEKKNSFTLNDIVRDKVNYVNDGSEDLRDSMALEVIFSPADSFILPVYLQGKFKFRLSVSVIPTNDPPILNIDDTAVLRVVQGTKKLLTDDIFKAIDPDNTAIQLVYNIIKSNNGHFELVEKSGTYITSFTQEDIENERILYVDQSSSSNDSYISLQVSDGVATSSVYNLRISISPQFWRLQNNTGLIVLHQTSSILTPYNLSFTSNVINSDYSAQFNIIKKPRYGVIELEKNVNVWQASDAFSSVDIAQHRVRYRHVNSKPELDEFQFQMSFNKSSIYTFRISFAKCTLHEVVTKPITLLDKWEFILSTNYLSFETKPPKPFTSINYVLVKPPKYGFIFSSVSKYRLKSCDTFSQEDIISQNIKYRLYQEAYSKVFDGFSFIVLSGGCNNITSNFSIEYIPSSKTKMKLKITNQELKVIEGSSGVISSNYLFLKVDFVTDIIFNVTEKPSYGILQIKRGPAIINDTDYFTLSEVTNNNLSYLHDDSESSADYFVFMALSTNANFQYVGIFNISIELKNDNSPIRVIDKIFHVVVGSERILTGNDLKYIDLDLGTPTSNIIYSCRETSNGNFYNLKNQNTKTTEFSQNDLDNNLIIFKHKGPEYGKVRLWVTDGKFHVNGVLEIQASAPFIHAVMNKKIIVEQGKNVLLTKDHLSYSTNLFANDTDVIYEIINQPVYGKIVSSKTLQNIKIFSQNDVNLASISYLNEIANRNADEVQVRIRCKDAVTVEQLGIWILPSIYWEPLVVKSNKKLSVEESTSVLITKKFLEVSQSNVPPLAITYYINKLPDFGYITILSETKSDDVPINIYSFTQDMINDNKVLYIQSGTNQTTDTITFNITNGIIWYENLDLQIEIIPERLYLKTNNLLVKEGGVVSITVDYLFVQTDYYKSKVSSYLIKTDVKHGCIQVHKRCTKSKSFSQKELQAHVVRYAHDGSENLLDEVVIVAEAGQKISVPCTLKIFVSAINDQKPNLVNNTGLVMWEGGTAVITNEMLAAIDDDMPKETLKYQVQSCWWGSVALISDIATSVNHFTQELINKNMVIFHHQNGSEGKFLFNISDGLHTTKDYTFYVKTKPVYLKLIDRPLHIFPMQRKYLTSSHLLCFISDVNRTIYYDIIKPPTLGRLMMESDANGIFKVVSSFTQNDLNESRIFYEHTHQFSDLYANDSFIYNVQAHLTTPLINQVLKIDISVSSGGLDAYVNIPKVTVDEGGMTTVPLNLSGVVFFLENHASLRSPIIHASASVPSHGQVFLKNNLNLTTFTQAQLESGQVYYEHDHSDSLGDNIYFSLYLLPGYITLCNLTVPVIVNPINDQPFNLVTPAPSLTVVQGENHTITRNELATEDVDTTSDKLKYDLISSPSHGKLVMLPKAIPVSYFTQFDIDENRLVYIHKGSSLKDSFQFRVWDGKFRPQFILFNIIVIPINITLLPGLPVYLQQGSDVVFLSEKQFFIETNADRYKISYVVKKQPKHGVLYVKDNPMLTFTQIDLRDENVMYLQTDMTTANDSFHVIGEISSGNTSYSSQIEVCIKVQPLMQIHNFTVVAGLANKFTLHVLDATPLAKLTNSNPRYRILTIPQHGQVRKVIRSSGEKRNVLDTIVNTFTHEDIQSGLIYLFIKDIEVPWVGICDKLVFVLAASIFQPAVGELKINIRSPLHNNLYSTLAGPSDPAGHEGGLHLASPNMTRDYLLIVSMVTGVVILGVAVIVIIKCRSFEVEELNKEEQCMQPIPLPRPPDRLMTTSPTLKSHSEDFTPPMATALPQCKVTPLNRSELEAHACYPYGVEEQADDWSSCDASDPPCPSKNIMLRRNQYWV